MTLPLWNPPTDAAAATPAQVADAFEVMATASQWFERELEQIRTSGAVVSQASVNRLVSLGERMRPAAAARTRLATLEPAALLAGIGEWVRRQRTITSGTGDTSSAATRAQKIWAAGNES